MELEKIILSVNNGIATVSMDSPKNMNAMDEALINDLVSVFNHCEQDPEIRVVILNSTGKAFSGGGDIGFMYKGIKEGGVDFGANLKNVAGATKAMKTLSKPIIGSINGAAAGGGLMLALACDYVIAAENAVFSAAFVNIGLIPDCGGLYLMTRAFGANKAAELALTGRPIKVEEAKDLGFVAKIVPLEELEEETMKKAAVFAQGPRLAYAKIKELMYTCQFSGLDDYIPHEVDAQLLCVETDDFRERVIAFVEKRNK